MAESNTYTGVVSGVTYRDTYQKITSRDAFSKQVQWACFNKTPFLKAVGVEAFGVEAMNNLEAFSSGRPTGRIIRYDSGVYAISGPIFATAGTSTHVGRMGSYTPELVEGGDEWTYAWHQLISSQFIPENDIDDNGKGAIDIKLQKMEGMKQKFVQDINYALLGNSNAPNYGVMGPSALYSDLPNLVSVTQTRTIGNIPATNTFWQNGSKAIASIGGGGDMDRPITLRRSLLKMMNDQTKYAEATADYLGVVTQGAWQYMDRLAYADTVQTGNSGVLAVNKKYDAAGIQHYVFNGAPLVWDPAVTVPYGATASTEAMYFLHIPSFFISIRSEKNFKMSDWEPPRNHDTVKAWVSHLDLRYTPGVSARRPHCVAYNLPQCAD
jgi:hypothetical protein